VLLVGGYASGLHTFLNTATLFNAGPAVAAPAPPATITLPASAAAGTVGLVASVPGSAGAAYHWTVSNGSVTGGLGTQAITFTTGAAGTIDINCLVVSAYGIPSQGSASLTVTP